MWPNDFRCSYCGYSLSPEPVEARTAPLYRYSNWGGVRGGGSGGGGGGKPSKSSSTYRAERARKRNQARAQRALSR